MRCTTEKGHDRSVHVCKLQTFSLAEELECLEVAKTLNNLVRVNLHYGSLLEREEMLIFT